MVIERGHGNLLEANAEALVNTVNTEGVMGKGIALQFRRAFPENFAAYEQACARGEVRIGRMNVVERLASPRYIINFPTKQHWRHPSKLEYIRLGLLDLVSEIRARSIRSIAMPPLGCGLGGLRWEEVRPLIIEALSSIEDLRVVLFEPSGAPKPEAMLDAGKKPHLTTARAVMLHLMDRYQSTGYEYRLSLLEAQKLGYFLQEAGEPLRLQYRAHYYGPYADNLRKLLRNIEGHYSVGLGDGKNTPETELRLLPGAAEAAATFLVNHPRSRERVEKVADLIEEFETPFGMELLATVHWVMHHDAHANDIEDVVRRVHQWSDYKRSSMKPGHIRAAWIRLREKGW